MSPHYKLISGIIIIVSIILAGEFFFTNNGDHQISEKNITNVQPTLSSALYVADFGIRGDGSDETAKLQSAFDYAASHDITRIVFPADKIIGINNRIETPKNMELIGNGCTIKLIDMSNLVDEGTMFVINEDCYVHHLKFDGNMLKQDGDDGYGEGKPAGRNGLRLHSGVRFENNEVFNVGHYTLGTYGDTGVVINNNIIHDSWQYGISTSGETGMFSTNITITNNSIYNCGQVGIKLRWCSQCLVEGNKITTPKSDPYNNNPSGIRLYSFDGPNDHIIISNNTVTGGRNPFDEGISSDDAHNTNITITGNYVSNTYHGIHIKFNNGVVTGNTIFHCVQCILDNGSGNIIIPNMLIDCP